jgi:hypothetical protein
VAKLAFPKRHKHADVRSREYLTEAEVERLRKAARSVGMAYVSRSSSTSAGISSTSTRDFYMSDVSSTGCRAPIR